MENPIIRVWDNRQGKYLRENNIGVPPTLNLLSNKVTYPFRDSGESELEQETLEKELFTGIKDSAEVEIYEGDILSCDGFTYVVGFKDCQFVLYPLAKSGIGKNDYVPMYDYLMRGCFSYQVIGNIHENKEYEQN
ncbi:YopX protein [Helicobacter pullorum MIT 98-5489]|uniref:YopX protein n=1 Tax=Helicobacter pullorum MIT 98-5489 TaxID=537972 RepID=C5F0C1_9HELI|nr:YopX family protein [Helicobacter pullorum]EEQ63715.1 YopX protein [Helicobacter pullorum MIT 98-5489]OCR07382.1 hypothetical protein A7X13_08775 [Helicobacter pullorum]